MAEEYTREDAIEDGRATAEENLKSEDVATRANDEEVRQENFESAREAAHLNHKVDQENQPEDESDRLENDTSKAAKVATAKSQLDPTGDDPISDAEVKRSATNASMETGNKTAVSNKEAAERAANPGEAEENAPLSTANANNKAGEPADKDAAHPSGSESKNS